jgi:DNA-binding beta-propeller fold protein YncE/cytochrome c peroxidase
MHFLFLLTVLCATPDDGTSVLRQPAALCLSADGSRLYVANGRSGTISIIDCRTARVASEHRLGQTLADLAPLGDGNHLLAVDQAADTLLLLEVRDREARVVARQAVAPDPVSLAVFSDGTGCVVASRWSRALTFVRIAGETLTPLGTLELPFSPHKMALVRGGTRLVVADAFGGSLAVVDPRRRVIESSCTLPGQNIRGLAEAPDGRTLVVAHQVFRRLARTSFEDIHWGSLVSNELLALRLDALLGGEPGSDPLRGSRTTDLGDPGNGAGDPAAVAFARDGHIVVVLGGVDEVRIGTALGRLPVRASVGRQPSALAISPGSETVYVANTLDGTISVLDLATGLFRALIALGPRPELTAAERGERLFSDARLSHDGWLSCQSCHTDGHSSGTSSDTLGDGGYGAPKRIPSLLGAGRTGPWGWLGTFEHLEDQVRQSIASTMQGPSPSETTVSDLVAYVQSLEAPAPAAPRDASAVDRGRALFASRNCAECHAAPDYTTSGTYDVGLTDEVGHSRFNPPSLRGLGRREPLLHDGRARTLEELFSRHGHPHGARLSAEDASDLSAFLKTL